MAASTFEDLIWARRNWQILVLLILALHMNAEVKEIHVWFTDKCVFLIRKLAPFNMVQSQGTKQGKEREEKQKN